MNSYVQQFTMPTQKVSTRQKNKQWKEACVDAVIGRSYNNMFLNGMSRTERMRANYDLYNGIYDLEDLKYVTNPFNLAESFPANPQEMNIIRPKIDLLLGEESKRPFNIRVIHSNQGVVSQLQSVKRDMLLNYVGAALMQGLNMDPEAMNDPGIMAPPQIEQYVATEYKDIAEVAAHHTLNYLFQKNGLDHEFFKNFKDALIAGEEIGYIGIQNGDPIYERVNPIFMSHDMAPDLEFIEDGDWAVRSMWMTPQQMYDTYFDKLDPSDLEELIQISSMSSNGTLTYSNSPGQVNTNYISYKTISPFSWLGDYNTWTNGLIRVWHATWRSFKKVGFLEYIDEDGEPQVTMVDENYKPSGSETVKWDWVVEIWEGYKAGQSKYFGIQPLEYQSVSMDNPHAKKLPYCGAIYSNANSRSRSLVDIMKSLQYFYIMLWYRLELMLSRDNGKAFLMDINQIPTHSNMDPATWMHYLKAFGVIFVDPYDQLEEHDKPASFNTFQSIDMTMANVISGYIELMQKIEEMAGELSGVSRQRQGSVSTNELVGNVERAVIQSSHITEWIFWTHNKFKKNVLTLLLNTAKYAFSKYDKKYLHYMLDDTIRTFLTIPDEFEYSDFDVFLADSTKEAQNIEAIKTLLQPAMQNGASLLDACEIVTADNVTILKKKIAEVEAKREQMIKEQQQAEQQMQQQQLEAQMQIEQQKQANQIKVEQIKMRTQIETATIQANSRRSDSNGDGINDIIDARRNEIEKYKADLAAKAKYAEIAMKQRESDLKAQMQEMDIAAKVAQADIDANMASMNLQSKRIEMQAKAHEAQANIQLKNADMEMKAADIEAKEQDVKSKFIDADIKQIELAIKEAELKIANQEAALKRAQIENDFYQSDIKAKEAEDKAYSERAKLAIESEKVDIEYDRMDLDERLKNKELKMKQKEIDGKVEVEKVKVQQAKVGIQQTEADIKKSKADIHKAKATTELAIKKAKEMPKKPSTNSAK